MMVRDLARNSSMLIWVLLLTSSMTPVYSNSYGAVPVVQEVKYAESNIVPSFRNFNKITLYREAFDLFGEVRGFTAEEAKLYEESLSQLFESTGDNFFDV